MSTGNNEMSSHDTTGPPVPPPSKQNVEHKSSNKQEPPPPASSKHSSRPISDRRAVTFSLLLDPISANERHSVYGDDHGDWEDLTRPTSRSTRTTRGSSGVTKESVEIHSLEVNTVLGNEQGLLDGGVDSKLDRPTGLTQSLDGSSLYFCEFGSHTIRVASLAGPVVRTVSGQTGPGFQDGPCSSAQFSSPHGICVLPMGQDTSVLIVADTDNHAIRCINLRTHTVTTLLCGRQSSPGSGQESTSSTSSSSDSSGGSSTRNRTASNEGSHAARGRGNGKKTPKALFSGKHFEHIVVQSPRDVCAAGERHPGVFFVCDAMKIIEINLLSRTCRILAGGADLDANNGAGQRGHRDGSFRVALFDHPTGLAFNQTTGNLYIADSHNHVIRKLYDNQVSTVAGSGKAGYLDGYADGPSRFKFPQKIAVDELRERLYVSDLNDVVRGVTLSRGNLRGKVWTVAGSGQPGQQDGPAATSTWQYPCGLVYSETEQILYCADSDNHCVRTIVAHEGWVAPLDAELYVHRALQSMAVPASNQHLSSMRGESTRSSSGVVLSSPPASHFPPPPTPLPHASLHSNAPSTTLQSKFRRTLNHYQQKEKQELDSVKFAIFRTNYMIQHPSNTVLLLAEALAVILQDPDLSHPELHQIDHRDMASKAHRMSIFQKRATGPSLLSQLKRIPLGQLSPRQIAKLIHCVQKLESSQMSKAPDLHRLKKWVITRCDAERFISEHHTLSTPFPPAIDTWAMSAPTTSHQLLQDEKGTVLNNRSRPKGLQEMKENHALETWEEGAEAVVVGDPEIEVKGVAAVVAVAVPVTCHSI